jgi:NADH-quinone oxidoreductase subunit L
MDALYDTLLVRPFKTISKINKNDIVDALYLAIAWLSRALNRTASASQTGRVRWYASSIVLGTAAIVAIGLLS